MYSIFNCYIHVYSVDNVYMWHVDSVYMWHVATVYTYESTNTTETDSRAKNVGQGQLSSGEQKNRTVTV